MRVFKRFQKGVTWYCLADPNLLNIRHAKSCSSRKASPLTPPAGHPEHDGTRAQLGDLPDITMTLSYTARGICRRYSLAGRCARAACTLLTLIVRGVAGLAAGLAVAGEHANATGLQQRRRFPVHFKLGHPSIGAADRSGARQTGGRGGSDGQVSERRSRFREPRRYGDALAALEDNPLRTPGGTATE